MTITLSDVVAVAGTVELLALLAVLVALGFGRRPTRLELEPRAGVARRELKREAA